MKRVGAILVASLAACSSDAAPSGAGLCWRMSELQDERMSFRIIARDVPNLESCATQLEGARMLENRPITGAYNSYFIFATQDQIASAKGRNGARIRVFEAEDRREIQEGLRALIEHQRSQTPPAG